MSMTRKIAALVQRFIRVHGSKDLLDLLDIELTERCNLGCVHCYIRRPLFDKQARAREMSGNQIYNILKEAVSLGCKGVRFTGGEPLIRDDFSQIYLDAYRLGLKVSIATNATLITDELAAVLAQHRPEAIRISIYGWNAESYDSTVGRVGAFENFRAGVERLVRHNLSFEMKYPVLKPLVENDEKIRQLTQQLGTSGSLPLAWELTLHAWNEPSACERIRRLRLNPEEAARQRLKEPDVAEHDRRVILNGKPFNAKIFYRRAAKKRLTVNAYGGLQVCLEMRHPDTIYDLRSGTLYEAVTQHLPRMKAMTFTDPVYLNRCGRCFLRPACPSCPAVSWMENGSLQTPVEYYCEVMHAEARLLGLLNDGEKGWEKKPLHNS
jgi:radical SAM protein with 4Fe4S-binding SPASM domain